MYKILFAGLGSIGQRHFKNAVEYLETRGESFKIDAVRISTKSLPDEIEQRLGKVYSYNDKITEIYDILFVTNPTSKHYDTVKRFSDISRNIFIEKPVFDNSSYNLMDLNLATDAIYYVACPLRYNSVLQYIKKNVDCKSAFAVRSISSSYLPLWRPKQDYRQSYSARRDMGGGVAIDLIHEWDYLDWLFGRPEKGYAIFGKNSRLEIDSDDIALYIAQKGNLTYELHLDYFGRSVIRELQIFLPEETILADIQHGKVTYLTTGRTINLSEDRNEYQMREIAHFFSLLDRKEVNDNDIYHAVEVLKIAEGKF